MGEGKQSPADLERWSRALDPGQDICWRDDDHSPEIRIQPHNEEHEAPAVYVEDPGRSCVSVNLEEDWIDEQRRLLGRVVKARAFAPRSLARRNSCIRGHKSASVHSARRRQQVMPEP